MLHVRKILKCGRNYHFHLPADWCSLHHIGPGSRITLLARLPGGLARFPTRVVAHARGLHATVPRPWRQSEGLSWGDPVLLLEEQLGVLGLQIVEGVSEKELTRRGEVVMLMRIAKARTDCQFELANAYREGYWRRALEECMSPNPPPITCPPRGQRGRGSPRTRKS